MTENWKLKPGTYLSYKCKVQLIYTYGISNIFYALQVKDIGSQQQKTVKSLLWNFLWNGKSKGLVNREICMMPRNVGGWRLSDLDVITQSMRIVFVDKVISQPDTKWKLFPSFFRFSFQNNFYLPQVTDSMPHLHHRLIPPSVYLNCIKYYQHFIKMNANTLSTNQEVRKEILWHNHRIQFNGKSLNFRHWATSGILRINDICDNGQISFDKIRNTLRNVSNMYFGFSKLIKAIPKEWKKSIR